ILWISTDSSGEGARIDYVYDTAGNLIEVKDRTGRVTTYQYNDAEREHYLTDVVDPRGVQTLKVSYDPFTGKVAAITDALGDSQQNGPGIEHSGFDGQSGAGSVTD